MTITTTFATLADKNFIGGAWVPSRGDRTTEVIDARTGEVMGHSAVSTVEDVDAAVAAAKAALPAWRALSGAERAGYLEKVAAGLEARKEEIAELISREVGTTIGLSRILQTTTPIHSFSNAAEIAKSFAFTETLDNSTIIREPIGVVGAISAWNFPLHLLALKAAFAMAAGCTVVGKPSGLAPLSTYILAEVIEQAGVPAGVFNVVFGSGAVVGEAIVSHPDVAMISFTGSTEAGRRIGSVAAGQVKKVALELGGKSPSIVLDGADLERAVQETLGDCFGNTGQKCDATTRLLVPRSRLAEAEKIAAEFTAGLTIGDPLDESTQIGPVISSDQRRRVFALINEGLEDGAKLIAGGSVVPDGLEDGFYVTPTVLSETTAEMSVVQEEIFGPVLVIQAYDTESEARALANDTIYGLRAAVWASDEATATEFARGIEAGMVAVNGGSFNPLAPFGGYKQSGIGREFGRFGFEEFLEYKSVQTSHDVRPWF